MADTATKPAYNPADKESEAGRTDFLFKKLKTGLYVAAPALVESYDRTLCRAVVRPAFMSQKSDGSAQEQSLIYDVPVRFCGGGGYAVNLPLTKGDSGWLIFCDRDISNFKSARSVMPLNTLRMHAQEDAFFLPDAMQTVSVSAEDAGRAVFQTLAGNNKISMGQEDIKITTGKLTVNASQEVQFNTPAVTMSGTLTVTGIIRSIADVLAGAISLLGHTHSGVTPGGGSTGGPQ